MHRAVGGGTGMSNLTNTGSNTTVSSGGLPSRRNTELAMLVFAVLVPVFAYANVGLAINDELPSGMLGYGFGMVLLAGVGHLVVRRY
ncbi:cell division protein FtsW, partial [Streptomyces nanshensis]